MLQLKILHVATKTQQSQKFFKVYFLKKRKVYFLQTKVKLKKKRNIKIFNNREMLTL